MNLLDEKWIPIKRADGSQDWVAPHQMTDPDIVSLDARRPDFNGALIQFLIGLVQTTTPMDSESEWRAWNATPPTSGTLMQWFEPVRDAFVFDGDGARFMQDFSLRTQGIPEKEFNVISTLLIESPGDNTLKENKDHFVKRGALKSFCLNCCAAALFTLQTNAPSGGQGHNTSIRGGGPLTTLMIGNGLPLWETVWLNIKRRSHFLATMGNTDDTEPVFTFPWGGSMTTVQPPGGQTTPIQVHPAHNFWGMPRRIRLDLDNSVNGICSCCGRTSEKLVTRYLTKAKGFDYKGGWQHPLSPYYESKPGEILAMHPQPGGFGYKHWLAWLLGLQANKKHTQPASIVTYVLDQQRLQGQSCRLWAFGYDMDNMKARCWYETTLPLYGLADKNKDSLNIVQREVANWLEAADHASFLLRSAAKSAWFGEKSEARGDFGFIDTAFWSKTEGNFYQLLRQIIDQADNGDADRVLMPLREQWQKSLKNVASNLFDADLIGATPIEQQNPRRVADAYNRLQSSLRGNKLKEILRLPIERVKATKSRSSKTTT